MTCVDRQHNLTTRTARTLELSAWRRGDLHPMATYGYLDHHAALVTVR